VILTILYACSHVKPDFLLIRQNLRDAGENYKNLLLGFRYGGVPSVNSIESIYNFQVIIGSNSLDVANVSITRINLGFMLTY